MIALDLGVGCPDCGDELVTTTTQERTLFRHGGHGAMRVTIRVGCRCGWTYTPEVSEVRP